VAAQIELRRDAGRVGPGHGPWIRDRQLGRLRGAPTPSEPVAIVGKDSAIVGWGLLSEQSRIRVRVLSWGDAPLPEDWLEARVAIAHRARTGSLTEGTTGLRMINSEGDGLPGLVVDRYDDARVVVLTTAPRVALRDRIVAALKAESPGPVHVVVPEAAATREGVTAGCTLEGDPQALGFSEHGLRFSVPPPPAQKTGAYFDQRANRQWVAREVTARGGRLLDLGCHAGGFALHARARGAEVVAVDRSRDVLQMAEANAAANGLSGVAWIAADMFGALAEPELAGPFDVIVADPPKIATRRSDLDAAGGAMRRLVARVGERLSPQGLLLLCSCSHHFGRAALDEAVARSGIAFTRVGLFGADLDHPVAPGHVEGEYLRVAIYRRSMLAG
jgi:23S rRNA (cytosine1962-C5)-methyltransferase